MAVDTLSNSYIHTASNSPLRNYTVGRLLDDVTRRFPNKAACIFIKDNTKKTFRELHDDVTRLADGFLQAGLKPRECVILWAEDSYERLTTDLAISCAGMISVRLPVTTSPERVLYFCEKLQCTAVVSDSQECDYMKEVLPNLKTATQPQLSLKELPNLKFIISLSPNDQTFTTSIDDVTNLGDKDGAQDELERVKQMQSLDDVYAIVTSSGSTGMPKAVAVPNRRFNNTEHSMDFIHGITMETPITEELRFLSVNSSTTAAYTIAEGSMLLFGSTTVFPYPALGTKPMLEAINKEKCNMVILFPMHINDMLNDPNIDTYDLKSIKYGMVAGNIIPPPTLRKFSSLLQVEVQQMYGSIEGGILASHSHKSSFDDKISNAGIPLYHLEARINDMKTKQVVSIGSVGEVWFRGYTIFSCYYGDKQKTKEVKLEDGWFNSGDVGRMDERGNLTFVGRQDDMIIKGSINIYPAEIEGVLVDHPKIKINRIVPVPDVRFINELCLCIVLQDGVSATEDEFKEYLKGKVDEYLIPRYVLFVTTMPVTDTAKVKRKELAALSTELLHLSKQ